MSSSVLKSIGKELYCCLIQIMFTGVIGLILCFLCVYYWKFDLIFIWLSLTISTGFCTIIFICSILSIELINKLILFLKDWKIKMYLKNLKIK